MYKADENRYEKMPYNYCGASGLALPAISVGLWQNFGDGADYDEMKDIIVDKYGQRTFEKLYNDYSKKHTDNFSRKTMQSLKTYLEKMNIKRHSFDKYL